MTSGSHTGPQPIRVADTGPDAPPSLVASHQPPAPGQLVAGVFEVESLLGVGAGGAVYRVREVDSGRVRALKVFAQSTRVDETLHEFRVLSRLRHPGCVTVHAFGVDPGAGAYLVMDLVEGAAPTEVLTGGESPALFAFARQILETLAWLHGRGVIHGDLKPSNIRCTDDDPARPVLLDFGLASTRDAAMDGGTSLYMAPELFRRQPRDQRSDLYALGVMLYEIAAGAPPYDGATDIQITQAHLLGGAPGLHTQHRSVSEAFSSFVSSLIAREAGARPGSAWEALGRLAELTGEELVDAASGPELALTVSAPELVHRDEPLAIFDRAMESAANGAGRLLVVRGAPGSGRTRLLDEYGIRGRLARARVVRWDPERTSPNNAVHGPIAAVMRDSSSRDATTQMEMLRRIAELDRQPEVYGEDDAMERVTGVITDVLHAASAKRPIAVLLDAPESAAGHHARFVARMARGLGPSQLVLVACFSEGVELPTEDLDPAVVLETTLEPLDSAAIAPLIQTAIGELVEIESVARWIQAESAGNAAAAVELLRWLVESGRLARRKGRWHLTDALETAGEQAAGVAGTIARRRLGRVPPELLTFLRAAAVAGFVFEPDLVARAASLSAPDDEQIARLLRSRLLMNAGGTGWRLRFSHRALQRALQEEVPEEGRVALHRGYADALLARADEHDADTLARLGILRDVAWHLVGAGDWQSGVPLARNAAERARREVALGEADSLYRRALQALEEHEGTEGPQAMILADLGDLAMDADHPAEAVERYREALALEGAEDAVDARPRLGHALVRLAHYDEAVEVLGKVVTDPKCARKSRVLAAHDLGWAHMLRSDWTAAARAVEQAEKLAKRLGDKSLRARVRKLRGNILWHQGRWEASLEENAEALAIYEKLDNDRGAAEALMAMGTAHRHMSRYSEAVSCYERALLRFQALGLVRGVGKCQNNLGIVHYYRGDWRAAASRWEDFLKILERTGERIERVSLLNNLGSLYRERGLFDRAETLLTEGIGLAVELGTRRHHAMLLGNLGDTLARTGRYTTARKLLESTIELSQDIGAADEEVEARRRILEIQARRDPATIDAAEALATLRNAREQKLRLEEANLLRILASHHRVTGRPDLADGCLEDAEEALAGSGAALEHARVRREKGLVMAAAGDVPGALRHLAAVEKDLEKIDAGWDRQVVRDAIQLVRAGPGAVISAGHLETLATFASQIGVFDDPRSFLQKALRRIVELVGADRGFICLFDDAGRPSLKVVQGSPEDGETTIPDRVFSRTITRDAHRADDPIYMPMVADHDRYGTAESVAGMQIGSVLAAPVRSRRRRRGVIYLDSMEPDRESLRSAVPLVGALGSVISASLEHHELLELERARNETMAMLAHELRGPLNGIYAHLELTREQGAELPPELRECLDVASSELLRLNRMISNLTEVARFEHHSSANTIVSIDVWELLSTVVATLSSLSASRRQTIHLDIADGLPFALGSRDRIIQVVTNLVTNAIKFSPDGGKIIVRARKAKNQPTRDDAELGPEVPPAEFLSPISAHVTEFGLLEISVEDSGPGVPNDALNTIFTKFRQSGSRKVRERGLGLGLAIARHIVERHGGRIWCENLRKGGAAFRFTIPTMQD